MASAVDLLLSRLNENLEYSHKKGITDNFFSLGVSPFMAMLTDTAESDNGGAGFMTQVKTRGTVGPNPRFNLTGTGAPGRHQFLFQPVNLEWRATWTRDELLAAATRGAVNAFDLAKERIDQEMHFVRHTLEKHSGGRGWGALAGVNNISSLVITLTTVDGGASGTTTKELTNRFYVGQKLNAAATEGGASDDLRGASPGTIYTVTDKDRAAGTITLDVTTNLVDGDVLFEYGFRNFDAGDGRIMPVGLYGWCDPVAASNGENFGGKDRFDHAGLQPLRVALETEAPMTTVKEKLIRMDEIAFTEGLRGSDQDLCILVHPREFRQLTADVEQQAIVREKIERKNSKGESYTIGVPSYQLTGHKGIIPIIPDAFAVNPGHAFWGPFKSSGKDGMGFKLQYAGESLINMQKDRGSVIRLADNGVTDALDNTVDGYKASGYFRGNISCSHPGNYLVGTELTDTAV